jgi:hypothetical protein
MRGGGWVGELYVVSREEVAVEEEEEVGHAAAVVAFVCDAVSTMPSNAELSDRT